MDHEGTNKPLIELFAKRFSNNKAVVCAHPPCTEVFIPAPWFKRYCSREHQQAKYEGRNPCKTQTLVSVESSTTLLTEPPVVNTQPESNEPQSSPKLRKPRKKKAIGSLEYVSSIPPECSSPEESIREMSLDSGTGR